MLRKFASMPIIAAQRGSGKNQVFNKTAARAVFNYESREGFLYVRSRAISSRCNENFDEFPAEEIKKAYRTFIGKPVFVNHHNDDHRRARGFIIDAALHEDRNPDGSPDTWVEVLMEVDAVSFPKLAKAVLAGEIDRTSMGVDVEWSKCAACNNVAKNPSDYCQHIPQQKGNRFYRHTASGRREGVLIREACYGLHFFENSLLVEDPADPTAFIVGVEEGRSRGGRTASRHTALPGGNSSDGQRGDDRHQDRETDVCRQCGSDIYLVQDGSPGGIWQHDIDSGAGLPHRARPGGLRETQADSDIAGLDKQGMISFEDFLLHATALTEEGAPANPRGHWGSKRQASLRKQASLQREAYGETKAPADVDTLRQDTCPICGSTGGAFDGDQCRTCGFVLPPMFLRDPDLDVAKQMDLRKDVVEDASDNPELAGDPHGDQTIIDPAAVSPDGEIIENQQVIDPENVDEFGNPIGVGLANPDENPQDPDALDPDDIDEQGNPTGVDEPGYPGDGVPDLVCPSCGFEADAKPPMTQVPGQKFQQQPDDGMVEGDVCPQCGEAQMMSPQDQADMQQQQQQVPVR